MNDPHRRRCWSCGHEDTYRDGVLPECACRKCGSADTRRLKSQVEKATEDATAAAEARINACLAACQGVEHLPPGCVAKLVEALVTIREHCTAFNEVDAQVISDTAVYALAAMKETP